MADKTVITELTIDARGAEVGSATYQRAMKAAQAAVDRQIDRSMALVTAKQRESAVYVSGAQSVTRVAGAWDRLRSSIDPVAAAEIKAQKAIEAATISADNAVKRGIASQVEAAAVLHKLKQQQLVDLEQVREAQQKLVDAQVSGSKVANNNSASNFNTANVAAQFQDVFVTAQMGMNPLQIAIQQGTQLSAVLGPMGAAGAAKSLGAALVSIVNPVSLVTIGLVAAAAAAIQYFMAAKTNAKTADQAVTDHAALISKIREAYGEASEGLKAYERESKALLEAQARDNVEVMAAQARAAGDVFQQFSGVDVLESNIGLDYLVKKQFLPFEEAIRKIRMEMQEGQPDFKAFYESINQTVSGDASLRKYADELILATTDAEGFARKLDQARAATELLGQSAARESARIKQFGDALASLNAIGLPTMTDADQVANQYKIASNRADGREGKDDAYSAAQAALKRIADRQAEKDAEDARKKAEQASTRETPAEKFGSATSNIEQEIANLKLQAEAIGMTAFEAQKAQTSFELMNAAKEAGLTIDPAVTEQIDVLSSKLADAQLTLEGLHETMSNRTPWETMGDEIKRLQELLDQGKISNDDFAASAGRAVEDMVGKYAAGANNLIDNLEKITDAMGLQGKAAFDVQKGLSIARAVVAGGEAIVHAYNAGMVFGPPVATAFAGIAAVATAAQIASIASTSYQSKSASSSAAAGGGGTAAAAAATPRQSTLIQLVGNSNTQVSLGDVKSLLDQLNDEASKSGMEIVTRFKGER